MKKFFSHGRTYAAAAVILIAVLLAAAVSGCGANRTDAPASMARSSADGGSELREEMGMDDASSGAPAPMPSGEARYEYSADVTAGYSTPALTRTAAEFAEKIVYSARVSVESVEFDKSLETLTRMIGEYGAFIENSSVSGADYESSFYGRNPFRSAEYMIRVPRESFQEMMDSLSDLGNVTSRTTSAENVTEQYTDAESRLKTYRVEEERLLAMLEKADTVADMITIESTLSNVRYEIESLTARLANLDNRVSYSSVYIGIREVEKLTEQEPLHQSYGQRILEGLKKTLSGIGNFFKDALRILIVNLPILAILAVIAITAVYIARRSAKKRRGGGDTDDKDK